MNYRLALLFLMGTLGSLQGLFGAEPQSQGPDAIILPGQNNGGGSMHAHHRIV